MKHVILEIVFDTTCVHPKYLGTPFKRKITPICRIFDKSFHFQAIPKLTEKKF